MSVHAGVLGLANLVPSFGAPFLFKMVLKQKPDVPHF
jgi:hypothetical protein